MVKCGEPADSRDSLTGPKAGQVGAQQKKKKRELRQPSCPILDSILELDHLLNVLKPVPDVPVLAAQLLILLDLERTRCQFLLCTGLAGSGFKTEREARQGN